MSDAAHPFSGKVKSLAYIDPSQCTGCGYCAAFCLMSCIEPHPDGFYRVDPERCIGCRSCKVNCPYGAVTILPPEVRS